MKTYEDNLPTRQSLLSRLKHWDDQESWRLFFETYWKLIYNAAIKAGLNDAEAQDVVQETVLVVLKAIPDFKYDAKNGSFKGWLLRQTSWRIGDQFRQRRRVALMRPLYSDTSTGTDLIAKVADPAPAKLEAIWDEEWEKNLFDAAVERVKRKVSARQYQVFELNVLKKWPASKVAQVLGINAAKVYMYKHRIGKMLKTEINFLRTRPI